MTFRSGKGDGYHPEIPGLVEQLEQRRIGRRDFLRTATLLGMSAATAYTIAGKVMGGDLIGSARAQEPKKGGVLRIGARVPALDNPATFSWVYDSNVVRQANDYLTRTQGDGVTVPILLEAWEPSEDLKTWTLKLRKDIKWSNGDALNAEHIIWNIQRWIDPNVGSSVLGLLQGFMLKEVETGEKDEAGNPKKTTELWDANAIEKVDDHTIRLNGQASTLAMPENLFHYPALILHPKDEGKWGVGSIGTGAFEPVEIEVGKKAVLKARKEYWGEGPYLDEVQFIDLGDDPATKLAALASKQVDGLYDADIKVYPSIQKLPHIELHKINTAQTAVARMHCDEKPFDDPRVRKAMRLAIDCEAVSKIAYGELGTAAQHHHVSPVHPEFVDMPMPRDLDAAKKLLADAGYPDGIDVELHAKKDPDWEPTACQAMVQQWAEAGIRVKLTVLPSAQYWDVWTKVPFGFTVWTHRPLGIMVLGLAYRSGVPWNESNFKNPKFDELLTKAEGIVDINARKEVIKEIEHLMQEEGPIVQPLWRQSYQPFDKQLKGYESHPTEYYFCEKMWWDK
ncbi:ABC transporter substrate-binding protein [Dongia sp.]|jgi:peptide/nickel transport system substrate-binding protein|uniref:ABC transporter substrate-binding protein n=1 Tax=Dongia sp. TaxID=1977262 RepID=UPI0035B29C9A